MSLLPPEVVAVVTLADSSRRFGAISYDFTGEGWLRAHRAPLTKRWTLREDEDPLGGSVGTAAELDAQLAW